VQRTKPYKDSLFVRAKAKQIRESSAEVAFEQLGNGPAFVKRGRMSTERKVQWVQHRIAALKLPKLTPNMESFVDFYKIFKEVSTYTGANEGNNAQHLAIGAFKGLTGFEVIVKSLPPDLRAEVESVTTGVLVERCESCGNKTCTCKNKWPEMCEVCKKPYVKCNDRDFARWDACAHCYAELFKALTVENWVKFNVSCRNSPYWPYEDRLAHHLVINRLPVPEPPQKRRKKASA
jgi:hypothetical protein